MEDHSLRWMARQELPDNGEIEARAKAEICREILDLEPGHIDQFYGIDRDEKDETQ